jgi:putative ABC transport system ATP-binding protein
MVCDEPTGDLDRETADEILNLLQVLNRDHDKTIIMVTHDPRAADHAKQTLHMDKGELLEQAA